MGRSSPASPRRVEYRIASDPANIAPLRRMMEAFAAECGFDADACGEIGLCVNEAVANIIRHAYEGARDRPILLTAEFDPPALRISIRDWGNGVNPDELPEEQYNPAAPGGVGMLCLRLLMDKVVFMPQQPGMLLVMTRNLTERP